MILPSLLLLVSLALVGADARYTVRMLALPVEGTSPISMDYIAFDPATRFVWVPAGNTGTV